MQTLKVYITPIAGGGWLVRSDKRTDNNEAVFKSKIEAIEEGLTRTSEDNLVIYSAQGRLMPNIDVPTSIPKEKLFRAILNAARKAGR